MTAGQVLAGPVPTTWRRAGEPSRRDPRVPTQRAHPWAGHVDPAPSRRAAGGMSRTLWRWARPLGCAAIPPEGAARG